MKRTPNINNMQDLRHPVAGMEMKGLARRKVREKGQVTAVFDSGNTTPPREEAQDSSPDQGAGETWARGGP